VTPVVVTGVAEAFYECVRTGDDYSLEMVVPSEVFERVNAMFPTLTSELMGIERASVPYLDSVQLRALDR